MVCVNLLTCDIHSKMPSKLAEKDGEDNNNGENGARQKSKCKQSQDKDTSKGKEKVQGMFGLCKFIHLGY